MLLREGSAQEPARQHGSIAEVDENVDVDTATIIPLFDGNTAHH